MEIIKSKPWGWPEKTKDVEDQEAREKLTYPLGLLTLRPDIQESFSYGMRGMRLTF